jgi:predicted nucleotidyltransferase
VKTIIDKILSDSELFLFHDELNPDLWNPDKTMKPEVAERLKEIANEFVEFLEVPGLKVEDVILTGSMANYNYSDKSDIDLHIIVPRIECENCNIDPEEYFSAKKTLWNEHHSEINIFGHPVELYVQFSDEPHYSSGVYSISSGEWKVEPKKREISVDDHSVLLKYKEIEKQIDEVVNSDTVDYETIEKLSEKIAKMRRSGLEKGGEFSTENLVFKLLRNNGVIRKLVLKKRKTLDKELSLEKEKV